MCSYGNVQEGLELNESTNMIEMAMSKQNVSGMPLPQPCRHFAHFARGINYDAIAGLSADQEVGIGFILTKYQSFDRKAAVVLDGLHISLVSVDLGISPMVVRFRSYGRRQKTKAGIEALSQFREEVKVRVGQEKRGNVTIHIGGGLREFKVGRFSHRIHHVFSDPIGKTAYSCTH